jgi:hypothetical protein
MHTAIDETPTAELEHVPAKLNRRDFHGLLDRRVYRH